MGEKNSLHKKSTAPARPEKKVLSREARQRFYLLIGNSVILLFLYFFAIQSDIAIIPAGLISKAPVMLGEIVCIAYWAAFAIFLLAYIIYNRAFTRRGITEDMLPMDWSLERKREYVNNGKERLEKSKWMMSVIIPLVVTIGADAIYLFTWPIVQNLFSIK